MMTKEQIKWRNEFKKKFLKQLEFDGELYKYIKELKNDKIQQQDNVY